MPDTTRGWFPDTECSDCGAKGCIIHHWGPLVPKGEDGFFCQPCALVRKEDYDAGRPPKPIGYRKEMISDAADTLGGKEGFVRVDG